MEKTTNNRMERLMNQQLKNFNESELEYIFSLLFDLGICFESNYILLCDSDGSGLEYLNRDNSLAATLLKISKRIKKEHKQQGVNLVKKKLRDLLSYENNI